MKLSLRDFLSLSVDFESGDLDLESGVEPLPNIPVMACMKVRLGSLVCDTLPPTDLLAGEFVSDPPSELTIPSMLSISLEVEEI